MQNIDLNGLLMDDKKKRVFYFKGQSKRDRNFEYLDLDLVSYGTNNSLLNNLLWQFVFTRFVGQVAYHTCRSVNVGQVEVNLFWTLDSIPNVFL